MEGNTLKKQLKGCSLTYQFPFHSLPDRAYKAGERKADAALEKEREKRFFFHFPVTNTSSEEARREYPLLLPSSWAFWSPGPGSSPPHGGRAPCRGSPVGAGRPQGGSAPRQHSRLRHVGAKGRGIRAWALLQHAGMGEERQTGVRGWRDRCVRRWGDTETDRLACLLHRCKTKP